MTEIPGWLSTEIRTAGKLADNYSDVCHCRFYICHSPVVLPLPQSYVRRQTVCDHSEESAPTMPALVNGGTFHSATGGTFQSDTGGTFHSDMPGTFESDMDGTFKVMQSN